MKRVFLLSAFILLIAFPGVGRAQSHDYKNMTPDQIEELKQRRHAFYTAKSSAKEAAIKRSLLDGSLKMNLNQLDYDVRYYGINLSLNFGTSTIDGYVDYKIKSMTDGLSSVDLNLVDQFSVTSVTVDGSPASFTHSSDLLAITTPTSYNTGTEFEMRVYYDGPPLFYGQQGMGFADIWGYEMCWTNCEPFGTRNWLPCKDRPDDKPDSIDLYLEYPSSYDLASNGAIVSNTDIGGGRKLIHYKHNYPIATYLIAITCADFNVHTQTWNYDGVSMPVYSFALPSSNGSYFAYRNVMPGVLTILSDAYGIYPFYTEKAGNANYGWGGAMEHQTCSFYNPGFYDDWVIAHETGHQWWGDMITCATFHHIWLNEGWASYTEALYAEATLGEEDYFSYMQSQKYLGSGTIIVEDLVNDNIFDGNLVYDKGSWVLHMLRGMIGDEAFFDFIEDYYNSEFRFSSATTEDLAAIASDSYGEDLTWYFDQWIYGDGHPDYDVSWQCESDETKSGYVLDLYIEQVQSGGTFFTMPIRTTFVTTGDDLDTVLWNSMPGQAWELHFDNEVTDIIVDPDEWILRRVNFVPFTMHIATTALPEGYLGVPYSEQLQAVGGVPPYHWLQISGDLPIGLSFDTTTATLSGTPSWPATYFFTLQVTDSNSPPTVDTRHYAMTVSEEQQVPYGDADGNGIVNISDGVFLIAYIFSGGPPPDPFESGDCDCNTLVNISDVVYLIAYVFGGGPPPGC